MATREECSMSDLEIGKYIGEGKVGTVYLAREKQRVRGGAEGDIFKAKLEKYRFHAHLRREIEIQRDLVHPDVLRLFGSSPGSTTKRKSSSSSSTRPVASSTRSFAPLATSTSTRPPQIVTVDWAFPSTPHVSSEAKDLISKLLVKDSSKRLCLDS
ncbi:hypothetical protein BDA96_03G256800 [Sorghum bicolor]|uniref:Protein kinase domain-containing protein n=1 Tax=Sorghum bicolor TaxID=4558 RepID=A0A921UNU4_SORBI|nr:hypothetical protein BDA96_03G256800 [Sorghum bicolor]